MADEAPPTWCQGYLVDISLSDGTVESGYLFCGQDPCPGHPA